MAIPMQGAWHVRVKTKSAAFAQQFVIAGSNSSDGVYAGATATPEIFVTGSNWTISVQHNPGSGFINSKMKVKFPQVVGGEYLVDIETDDSGGDLDFNDLILTCRMPVTADDYLVYGHVACYGRCLFNPCFPFWVIDTPTHFFEALKIPILRNHLKIHFPELVEKYRKPPKPIGPDDRRPSPFDFTPIVVPQPGELATPLKTVFYAKTEEKQLVLAGKSSQKAVGDATNSLTYRSLLGVEKLAQPSLSLDASILKNRADLASTIERTSLYFPCDTTTLQNVVVRFFEYDRTASEKSGGAYTGLGNRSPLGSTLTDDFGNYVFRFYQSPFGDFVEGLIDTAPGEDRSLQSAPDVIAQVMDALNPNVLLFETAPHFNIGFRHRMNVCVPKERCGHITAACDGQNIIQRIGNTFFGIPQADGSRTVASGTFQSHLSPSGILTSAIAGADCAAWRGGLFVEGCLKNAAVKFYSLEIRKGFGAWQPFDIPLDLPAQVIVGGTIQTVSISTKMPSVGGRMIYRNLETDTSQNWVNAAKTIKAIFSTNDGQFSRLGSDNGTFWLQIQGLDGGFNPIAGVLENIPLFFFNKNVDIDIADNLTMNGVTVSNCGLFTLPADERAPISVRFLANQELAAGISEGFMSSWALTMQKGATGGFPISGGSGSHLSRSAGVCDLRFHGTADEPIGVGFGTQDGSGLYSAQIVPSQNWLEPTQGFCAFGLYLNAALRLTNGSGSTSPSYSAIPVLIGIQR